MTIRADEQLLEPGAKITLFVLDITPLGGPVYRFTKMLSEEQQPIIWQGNQYNPWPLDAEGFEWNGRGQIPRPTLKVANPTGFATALCLDYDDLVGVRVTRKTTLVKYLDGANFPKGNFMADPNAHWPDEIYLVNRKVSEDKQKVVFELTSPWDVEGVRLPRRFVVQNVCPWEYRKADGCGYAGAPVAKEDDTLLAPPYVLLPGTSGNYLSAAPTGPMSILGDIDIRIKCSLVDWTPATITTLVAKRLDATNQSSWQFRVQGSSAGTLSFNWTTDGITFLGLVSTIPTGIADGAVKWLRVAFDADNGAGGRTARFYLSDDGAQWNQLGADVTSATPTTIFDGTAPLTVGAHAAGGISEVMNGKVYYAEVRNEIYPGLRGVPYLELPNIPGSWAATESTDANSVTGDIDIRALARLDDWSAAEEQILIGRWETTGDQRCFMLGLSTTGTLHFGYSRDGIEQLIVNSTAPGLVDKQSSWVRVTRIASTGVISFYKSVNNLDWDLVSSSNGSAGNLFDSTADVQVGEVGGLEVRGGRIYKAMVLRGVEGDLALIMDAEDSEPGETGFTSGVTGEFWSLTGAARLFHGRVVARLDPADAANQSAVEIESDDTGETWVVNQSGGSPAAITWPEDPALDVCGKRVASCKLRFGDKGDLPIGSFPSVGLIA